jgi:hypothetical protein
MSSTPYRLDGLNTAYKQGQADRRAGRPARNIRDMSTFYAAAYLRGYKGQRGHRVPSGKIKFTALVDGYVERRVFGTLGVRNSACSPERCRF